ncbi:MAG: methyl-accepting chemotaxis protein [Telluria sp.]
MRKNLPVTGREYVLDDGRPIVSMTDLKGKITYVNPYFVEVSGFSIQELIGAPHNLVRHPDMPPAAFADLWDTLKRGDLWSAPVKNRRKNGDFYWVHASVTPIRRDGRTVGYMSVRTKPSRAEIDAASALYQELAREDTGLGLRGGQVQHRGARGLWQRLRTWPAWLQLACPYLVNFALLLAVVLYHGIAEHPRTWPSAVVLTAAAIYSSLCYRWQRRHLVDPLGEVTRLARALAGGAMNEALVPQPRGLLGPLVTALNQLNVNLVAIIGDIRASGDHIRTSSGEIAAGNADLSARTEAQASSLEETASSMEQFAATVANNAAGADSAAKLTSEAARIAERAGQVVESVGAKMDDISHSAQRVADIIGVIDGIAFQTNILALNAAVEAARAGEQGRGFAVVASEVRALAQRSAAAAKEIKQLVDGSVRDVAVGNELVAGAVTTMSDVLGAVSKVAAIVGDIAQASREQASGIQQVNEAIAHLDQVTQQNASLVEQAAAASAGLRAEAAQMHDTVGLFQMPQAAPAGLSARTERIAARPSA